MSSSVPGKWSSMTWASRPSRAAPARPDRLVEQGLRGRHHIQVVGERATHPFARPLVAADMGDPEPGCEAQRRLAPAHDGRPFDLDTSDGLLVAIQDGDVLEPAAHAGDGQQGADTDERIDALDRQFGPVDDETGAIENTVERVDEGAIHRARPADDDRMVFSQG